MYADPPEELLAREAAKGEDTNVAMRLKQQLYGGRKASAAFGEFVCEVLTNRLSFERCLPMLSFYANGEPKVVEAGGLLPGHDGD